MRRSLVMLVLAFLLVSKAAASGAPAVECDRLAAHPLHQHRVAAGVDWHQFDGAAALKACAAAVIARFAEVAKLTGAAVPDAEARHLAALVARRRQLVGMATAEENRLQQAPDKSIQRSIRRLLRTIEAELSDVDRGIGNAIKGSPL